jgi:hypothetical protein
MIDTSDKVKSTNTQTDYSWTTVAIAGGFSLALSLLKRKCTRNEIIGSSLHMSYHEILRRPDWGWHSLGMTLTELQSA